VAKLGKGALEALQSGAVGLSGGEIKSFVKEMASTLECSRAYVYKLIDGLHLVRRKTRADERTNKNNILPEQWKKLLGMTITYDLPAFHAIEEAESRGIIPAGAISPALYNRRLKTGNMTRARAKIDTKPVRRFEKSKPNATHQFDTTKLEELFVDADDVVTWAPKRKKLNSRGEKAPSLWLYSIVDDYSRAKFAYIYKFEHQFNHLDFLFRAWSKKDDPRRFPFYGIPKSIYMDLGSVNHAKKILASFDKLGVFVVPTVPSSLEPHGSRKRGKVERVFQDYDVFVRRLRLDLPLKLGEVQARLESFVIMLNNRWHRGIKTTPFARWMQIATPKETPAEELYRLLHYDNTTRIIDGELRFTLDGHVYQLPARRPYVDWIKLKVDVHWIKGQYEKVNVVRGYDEVEVNELADLIPLSINRTPIEQTSLQIKREEILGLDYSSPGKGEAARVSFMDKQGEPFDGEKISEKTVQTDQGATRPSFAPERYLSYVTAVRQLQADGFLSRPLSDPDQAWIKGLFNGRDQIPETEFNQAVNEAKVQTRIAGDG